MSIKIDYDEFNKHKEKINNLLDRFETTMKEILICPQNFTIIQANKLDLLKKDCESRIKMMEAELSSSIQNKEREKTVIFN